MRRFQGYTAWNVILLRQPAGTDFSLVVHELCHVWQMQHHPIRMPLSYLMTGYAANPFEQEARRVAGHPPATPRGDTRNGSARRPIASRLSRHTWWRP